MEIAEVGALLRKVMKAIVSDRFGVIAVLQNDDENTFEATRSRIHWGTPAVRLKGRIGPRGFIHRGAGEIKARKATASVAKNHGHAERRKANMQSI